jgi:hypothetical protein
MSFWLRVVSATAESVRQNVANARWNWFCLGFATGWLIWSQIQNCNSCEP